QDDAAGRSGTHLLRIDANDSTDRIRPVPVPTGAYGVHVIAEAQHDALRARLHDKETGQQPDNGDDRNQPQQQRRAGPRTTAGSAVTITATLGQTRAKAPPELIQVRRTAAVVTAAA